MRLPSCNHQRPIIYFTIYVESCHYFNITKFAQHYTYPEIDQYQFFRSIFIRFFFFRYQIFIYFVKPTFYCRFRLMNLISSSGRLKTYLRHKYLRQLFTRSGMNCKLPFSIKLSIAGLPPPKSSAFALVPFASICEIVKTANIDRKYRSKSLISYGKCAIL